MLGMIVLLLASCSMLGIEQSISPPVITWERTGGIAGICQHLSIGMSGGFQLMDCKDQEVLASGKLPKEATTLLNGLQKGFTSFTWKTSLPPGSADMYNDSYTFNGAGQKQMAEAEQIWLNDYLASLALSLKGGNITKSPNAIISVDGLVLIGPTCPGPAQIGTQETACADKPYQARLIVLNQQRQTMAETISDEQGQFHLLLPPGDYLLHGENLTGAALPYTTEQTFTVEPDSVTALTVLFDSGMR